MQESPSSVTTSSKPKRVKGPNEDAWLRTLDDRVDIDRNRLDSLRRCALNPDLFNMRKMHCYCGNDVHLDSSWYVMVRDGTLVCNSCARCSCCSREARPNSRRLVSVDGLVLCYRCIQFYGYKRQPILKMRVEQLSMKDPLSSHTKSGTPNGDGSNQSLINRSNSEYYDYNATRIDRCLYSPKDDKRHLIRPRYYDPPIKTLPRGDNPCVVPPVYLAEDGHQCPMLCAACNSISIGPGAYIVPSMGRVYHRRCFRCCNCKDSLAYGVKFAGLFFEFCSCEVPLIWCTRQGCREARNRHHVVAKCHLGCLRPGGRVQMDFSVEPSSKSRRRKRANKRSQVRKEEQQGEVVLLEMPSQDNVASHKSTS